MIMDLGSLVNDYCNMVTLGGQTPKRLVLFVLFCLVLVGGLVGWERTGMIAGVIALAIVPFLLFLTALGC